MRFLFAAVFVSFAAPASAGFINNKQQWDTLREAEKFGYIMGVLDGITTLIQDDPHVPMRQDMLTCTTEMGMLSSDLIEVVDTQYEDLENWRYPPNFMLLTGLTKVCRDIYNRERLARGEEPMAEPEK